MADNNYYVRFPLDFFDDPRVKVIETMPSGDTIICLWIRCMFLRVSSIGTDKDGAYLVHCGEGSVLTEAELCGIAHNTAKATHYALSVLDRFGVYPKENATEQEAVRQ